MEYKASQIVRSQDRIRQNTLSSRYKMFSKLAREVDRTEDRTMTVQSQIMRTGKLNAPKSRHHSQSMLSVKESGTGARENTSKKPLEAIIEYNKNNRKINERSLLTSRHSKMSGSMVASVSRS